LARVMEVNDHKTQLMIFLKVDLMKLMKEDPVYKIIFFEFQAPYHLQYLLNCFQIL
jgi:hypothetical protein